MDYRVGQINRVFFLRFDDGEELKGGVEDLARREGIEQALVLALGALGEGRLVVGPREKTLPPEPVWAAFSEAREVLGVGTLSPGPEGPALHLHLAAGRGGEATLSGCLRGEGRVYLVLEAVVLEMTGFSSRRRPEAASNLNLLAFE